MFNDHLSAEEARERIIQRIKEAEAYSLQKRLGFGDYRIARWVFALVILVAAAVLLF